MEIFKEIKGFEGLYEVSNHGNVKSLKRNIILSKHIVKGYYYISLYKDGNKPQKQVHRLVAIAFIPNPNNFQEVNHKDENPLNNFVWVNEDGSVDLEKSNLEWCTHEYNINYGTRTEKVLKKLKGRKLSEEHKAKLRGKKRTEETRRKISKIQKNNPKTSKAVVAVDSEGNVVHEFPSTKEAGRNGFNYRHVGECCNHVHNRNTHKGYRWFFKSEWEEMQQATHDRVACGKLDLQ